jgi:hypothetical protein
MSDQEVLTLRRLLEESGLIADPALGPVIDLVVRIQSERQRPIWATRSNVLYALARLHPQIHAAVFRSMEAWEQFVSELALEQFDPEASGGDADAGAGSREAQPDDRRGPRPPAVATARGTVRSPRRARRGHPE